MRTPSSKTLSGTVAGLLLLACGAVTAQDADIREIEDSVIKIHTTQAAPDYFVPWRLLNPRQTSGSGVLIDANRIL
ncbi:MAG: hypothetical protein OXI17_12995, partial [Gammaproteobacteria bacterium]|nr:hypothetical protein [Gammaproteobacteria bacterium]